MNREKPLVSILINAYNAEHYIKDAIDSALAQTWPTIEIIVLDDDSTDHTPKIVRSYHSPQLRYVHQEHQGLVGGRNRLLREAHGEFLTWLDSDDIYLPEKVEQEAEYLLTHPNDDAVYCDTLYFFVGNPSKFYKYVRTHYSGKIFGQLLDGIFINNTAFMMRRSVVERVGYFDPTLGVVEDWAYFLKMARQGMQFGYIDTPLLKCRLREDSLSSFKKKPLSKESIVATFQWLSQNMNTSERAQYHMETRIQGHYRQLGLAYLGARRKSEFFRAWQKGGEGWLWHAGSVLLYGIVLIIPGVWITRAIESAARIRKHNFYVPAEKNMVS